MNISGTRSFTPLRQPASQATEKQAGQRLVFVYPILFDSKFGKLTDLLRDFMVIDFIGQVKLANIRTIVSTSTHIGQSIAGGIVNPADEIRKSFHSAFNVPPEGKDPVKDIINIAPDQRPEYQEVILNHLNFIRNQLIHDPRYTKLRPLISSIVVEENLLQIPLIVGTKTYSSDANALYWILLVSMAYNDLPLNNASNIDKIGKIIQHMKTESPQNFIYLLFDTQAQSELERKITGNFRPQQTKNSTHKFNKIIKTGLDLYQNKDLQKIANYTNDNIQITCNVLKSLMNLEKWDAETNHISTMSNQINQANIPIVQSPTQKRHFNNAISSFSSYVSSIIIPSLYSMQSVMGPIPFDIDFDAKLNQFTNNTIDSMEEYYSDMINHITLSMIDYTKAAQDYYKDALDKIKELKNMCEQNIALMNTFRKIITKLDRHMRISLRFTTEEMVTFAKVISESSHELKPHSESIEKFLLSFVDGKDQFQNRILTIKDRFQRSLDIFFGFDTNSPYNLYDSRLEHEPQYFADRYSNFFSIVCGGQDANSCSKHFQRFIIKIRDSIADIMYFFFIWNFLIYICEYMADIEIDIEIQRRDALDFPNYCMVLPLSLFKYLYTVHTVRNFRNVLNSDDPYKDLELQHVDREDILINSYNINRVIKIVNSRLKVPNLIVVDEAKEMIYYQFMYMSEPNKITFSALKNYVQHQQNVLPGF